MPSFELEGKQFVTWLVRNESAVNTCVGLARTIYKYIYIYIYTVCIRYFWQGNH
jgi:hypothetical protein